MSRHEVSVTLQQMLDYAREALDMAHGCSRADLDTNLMLNRALVRTVEVIGEAAGRVPREYRSAHTEIPWQEIIGLRNRLIHGYDQVDFDVLWRIVSEDVPTLVAALAPLLQGC